MASGGKDLDFPAPLAVMLGVSPARHPRPRPAARHRRPADGRRSAGQLSVHLAPSLRHRSPRRRRSQAIQLPGRPAGPAPGTAQTSSASSTAWSRPNQAWCRYHNGGPAPNWKPRPLRRHRPGWPANAERAGPAAPFEPTTAAPIPSHQTDRMCASIALPWSCLTRRHRYHAVAWVNVEGRVGCASGYGHRAEHSRSQRRAALPAL